MGELKQDSSTGPDTNGEGRRFEIIAGLILTVFAAILAITDLGGGKFGDDEIMGTNEKANVYSWYQSKSVKQSQVEGQRDLIRTLMDAGSINPDHMSTLDSLATKLEADIARYKKEKTELMLGSAGVGKENWIQDIDGQLGKVVGAKEWEAKLQVLGKAGDKFDIALLFLQLSLVLGAISLVLQQKTVKWLFCGAMVLLGIMGSLYSLQAFLIAMSAG